jgi:hypothetical protein
MQVARIAAIPEDGGDAGRATFQRRQSFLKHSHGWIREAGIDIARNRATEPGGSFSRIGEDKAGSGENRLSVFAFQRAGLASAHRQRGETPFGRIRTV